MKRILSVVFLFLMVPAVCAAEGTLYVQSARAKVLSAPKFGASEVATLEKGTPVSVVKSEGRWYRIAVEGKDGWVSKFVVSDRKPLGKVTVLGGKDSESIDVNARRRASAVTTAGAARGLTASERRRASDADHLNYRDLSLLETVDITDDEALTFLAEGLAR